jgi:hypothetical protein
LKILNERKQEKDRKVKEKMQLYTVGEYQLEADQNRS